MPPRAFSRYLYTEGVLDEDGNLYLTDREPLGYQAQPDDRYHVVVEGDTLHGLAEKYFSGFDDPADLFWVIADYQPEPICFDPTIALPLGVTLVIPPTRLIREKIFRG